MLKRFVRKIGDLLGPSPYTGEQPETQQRNESLRRDYTVAPEQPPKEYSWAMTPTHVLVGTDNPQELLESIGGSTGPHAYGVLNLYYNWDALWEIQYSNIDLRAVEKRLKKYTKDQYWNWEDVVNSEGDSFSRKASVPGIGEINPGVKDWRNKEWSGTDMYDNPGHEISDKPFYGLSDYVEERPMSDPRVCSECGFLALDYDDWRKHVVTEHINPERAPSPYPWPVVDLDDVLPAGFNEAIMDRVVQRQAGHIERFLSARRGKPSIPGPIPFIYDIEEDRIYVGHPGERHSDIQGRFTPGGIVEGMYDPKGNVQIRTDTDMPYTVRHMIRLWYALHPELEVKSVYLLVGDKKYKLASSNIGHKVRNLVAADEAAWAVYQALRPIGKVYVVGGAVRDVILGKVPKDIDLMVTKASAEQIENVLRQLPGRLDYTGRQFGVYRYRDPDGHEVEVAMPRTERSTGPGHKDFEIYTDENVPVEKDLARRDFTSNAIAVELDTGRLIDPYRGTEDLKSGILDTVSDRAFIEDPLRILRVLTAISRHQLTPTRQIARQISENIDVLDELPAERIQTELDKVMAGEDPGLAFEFAAATGIMAKLMPELYATVGFDQKNKWHNLTLFDHLREVLNTVVSQTDDLDVRWAALLHDIGKPAAQWIDAEGHAHYYKNEQGQGEDHEIVGSDLARELLTRLKFPTARVDRITHLIRWHMYPEFSSLSGARKFINRVGEDYVDDLLALRWSDSSSGKNKINPTAPVDQMRELVQQVRFQKQPTTQAALVINGNDLIAEGFEPGPMMGDILRYLTEMVLEDPTLNTRETLLQLAKQYISQDQSKLANILDPIHDTLDPDVFKRPASTRPDVHDRIIQWVKAKIYRTLVNHGWPDPQELDYLRLVLTGSLTTYQWSDNSDFDVSLWVITERLPEWVRADLIGIMVENVDGTIVPGTTHPMQVFVVDTFKYTFNDLYKPGMRSAYDLDQKKWIVPPERDRVKNVYETYPAAINYAKMVEDKVRMMLRYDHPALEIYYKFLHHQRQRDMIAGKGDYSLNNIVYKWLANRGLLSEISQATGIYIA